MKIAVLITCFNRKDKTIKCLKSLKVQFEGTQINYDVHLTDDGCTDGTAEAVLKECPKATIYKGGNLFWAGGMRLCWSCAKKKGNYDYFLLLNDDTYLNDKIVEDFLECHELGKGKCIIRGNTQDPSSGKQTYPSFIVDNKFLYTIHSIEPTGKPEYIDIAGANILFVPKCIVDEIGIFPSIYKHSIADFDYCLRSRRAGFEILQTSHYCGFCEADHSEVDRIEYKKWEFAKRWRYLFEPKGIELKQQLYFQYCFFPWRVPCVFLNSIRKLFFV